MRGPFPRGQCLQSAATLRGENLKWLLPSTVAEEGKWSALLEVHPAARMAQGEESISEMDRYALAVHRDPARQRKLSFSWHAYQERPEEAAVGGLVGRLQSTRLGALARSGTTTGSLDRVRWGMYRIAPSTDCLLFGGALTGGWGRGRFARTSWHELLERSWLCFSSPELIDNSVNRVAE